MRADNEGGPSRNRAGMGSRANRARQPEGNRAATAGDGANGERFILRKGISISLAWTGSSYFLGAFLCYTY